MIEVIKHGQKKFKATCTICGCEFTYELDDTHPLGCTNCVDCPDCGHYVVHHNFNSINALNKLKGDIKNVIDTYYDPQGDEHYSSEDVISDINKLIKGLTK